MFQGIDFFSDTVTRPSAEMRRAMAEAVVGDEQLSEDPTTRALEEKVAEITGHSYAVYFPSATMANQVALQLHCRPGDEIVLADTAHIYTSEVAGAAFHARAQVFPVPTPTGVFSVEALQARVRPSLVLAPRTRLVVVENTANFVGGLAWPRRELNAIQEGASTLGLKTHVDGARLFNAAVASDCELRALAAPFDTVTLCFSKGLGCPSGAALAFSRLSELEVRRLKQAMGGALRQSGILAAAALYALENNVSRLRDDHANAEKLRLGLSEISGLEVESVEGFAPTNMVFFRWVSPTHDGGEFLERSLASGVRFSPAGPNRFRAVTHLDVTSLDVEAALERIQNLCKQMG